MLAGMVKNSDGAVFRESQLGKSLFDNKINIPPSKLLPNYDIKLPHVYICRGWSFFIKKHNIIMLPLPGSQLGQN